MRNPIVADFESVKRKSKKTVTEISQKPRRHGKRPATDSTESWNTTSGNVVLHIRKSTNGMYVTSRSGGSIPSITWRCLAAQEEERRRIARELHDGLNQELALIAINLGILLRRMPKELSSEIAMVSTLRERMESVSDDLRKMTHQLHPAALEHRGLVAALRNHIAEFSQASQIPVTFTEVQVPDLSQSLSVCLYRIVQESLLNVAKHSMATEAWIKLKRAPGGILLSIADNGCGLKCDNLRETEGLGLVSIQERVQAIHGQLIINSAPGRGLSLEVYAPVRWKDQKREESGRQESNPLHAV